MSNRLQTKYIDEVQSKLMTEFNIKNKMAAPKVTKIIISIGLGEAKENAGVLDKAGAYMKSLSGQTPVVTLAKKSIASFKVSKGQTVGMMVTLRGDKMYAFLDKFINVVLPKVRDFRGLGIKSFDAQGNLNIGMREQTIFPEVDYKDVDKVRGLAITIVTEAKGKEQSQKLLEYLGLPFRS